jgi:hypothetical protein
MVALGLQVVELLTQALVHPARAEQPAPLLPDLLLDPLQGGYKPEQIGPEVRRPGRGVRGTRGLVGYPGEA